MYLVSDIIFLVRAQFINEKQNVISGIDLSILVKFFPQSGIISASSKTPYLQEAYTRVIKLSKDPRSGTDRAG